MESDILQLSEKQKTALSLRQQGFSYRAIGERMGISESSASQCCKRAVRKMREYAYYTKKEAENQNPVTLTVTRGQLKIIVSALRMFAIIREFGLFRDVRTDFRSGISFDYEIITGLLHQLEEVSEKGKDGDVSVSRTQVKGTGTEEE